MSAGEKREEGGLGGGGERLGRRKHDVMRDRRINIHQHPRGRGRPDERALA